MQMISVIFLRFHPLYGCGTGQDYNILTQEEMPEQVSAGVHLFSPCLQDVK